MHSFLADFLQWFKIFSLYLYLFKLFKREKFNLHYTLNLSFPEAALGTKVNIPTLEKTIDLKIDPGVQTGSLFRIRGEGVPMLNRKGRGDLLVEIVVSTPKKLNKDAKELFKQLAEHLDISLDSKEGWMWHPLKKNG